MDSRPIMKATSPLGVLLDTASLDRELAAGDVEAQVLLEYSSAEHFEFLRAPGACEHGGMRDIASYAINDPREDGYRVVTVNTDAGDSMSSVLHKRSSLQFLCEQMGVDSAEAENDNGIAVVVAVAAALGRSDRAYLVVTANDALLSHRTLLKGRFWDRPVFVATVGEAKEIMDLFAKKMGKYHIGPRFLCNKGPWYWYSYRSRIPHYNVEDGILTSLANRFTNLLMSIDEMGIQYYSGVDNDTMRNTLYHFFYYIILLSGVFDSLAIKAGKQLQLRFKDDHIPSRTSLNPKAGRNYLRALEKMNADLHGHTRASAPLIALVYCLREEVTHREMPRETSFKFSGSTGNWEANFLWTEDETVQMVERCGDSASKYDSISEWGVLRSGRNCFIEPFHFAKASAQKLGAFVDRFLELLGYENWIEQAEHSATSRSFGKDVAIFRQHRLGF
jgi:hypothetical protein